MSTTDSAGAVMEVVEPSVEPCGLLWAVDRCSTVDGPGLRSTVRLKGCPLRCAWCKFPEGQAFLPEVMLFDEHCTRCGRRGPTCELGRQVLGGDRRRFIPEALPEDYLGVTCPLGNEPVAAVGKVRTVAEVMDLLSEDEALYVGGGGVTISGGEPLFQAEYALALLRAARDRGWHVALDTSGYAPPLVMAEALGLVDLLLFDIKETNSNLHTAWCGVPFEPIRDNLELAAESGVELWLRCPVVPPLNDRDDHWQRVGELAARFDPRPVIELLPYEPVGELKRRGLGRANFILDGLEVPTPQRLGQIARRLTAFDLEVRLPR